MTIPYSLTPAVNDPVSASEMLSLLDQLAAPSQTEPQSPEPTPVGRTYAFDFQLGQLIPSPNGGPVMLYGFDSIRAWIAKTLATDRAAAAIHKLNDYGLDGAYERLDGDTFDESAAASWEATTRDALLQHPRISLMTDWTVDYDDGTVSGNPPDEAVYISFTVHLTGDDVDPLAITRYPILAPLPSQEA